MSGDRLRAELERIAEGAPRVDIPSDLYARGRRATARARVLAAGAAVAVVALLAVVVAPTLQTDRTPVASGDDLGVPDQIHAVPLHVDDRESDFKVGRGAAAFVTEEGTAVVVDAATGDYHLFDLDGLLGASPDSVISLNVPPVSLSPDGRFLAWGWAERTDDATRPLSGIRVADLESGEVLDLGDLPDTEPDQRVRMLVNQLAWSPNGTWLVWGGTRITKWTENAFNTEEYVGGTMRPGRDTITEWTTLPEPTIETEREVTAGDVPFVVAGSDDGEFTALSGNLWIGREGEVRLRLNSDQRVSTIWFEGDRVFALVHAANGKTVPMVRQLPDGQDRAAMTLASKPRILGVLSDGRLLAHEGQLDDDSGAPPKVEAVTPDGATEMIIDVDPGVLGLTLASDLMSPDHLTVERPEPDWPWSTNRKIAVRSLALLGVILLGGVLLNVRRFRNR